MVRLHSRSSSSWNSASFEPSWRRVFRFSGCEWQRARLRSFSRPSIHSLIGEYTRTAIKSSWPCPMLVLSLHCFRSRGAARRRSLLLVESSTATWKRLTSRRNPHSPSVGFLSVAPLPSYWILTLRSAHRSWLERESARTSSRCTRRGIQFLSSPGLSTWSLRGFRRQWISRSDSLKPLDLPAGRQLPASSGTRPSGSRSGRLPVPALPRGVWGKKRRMRRSSERFEIEAGS